MPKADEYNRKLFRAEIKLHAGIYNRNRALFEEGLQDCKTHTMAFFDMFENDETLTPNALFA